MGHGARREEAQRNAGLYKWMRAQSKSGAGDASQGCETLEQFGSDMHYLCQMEPHACVDENGWINYSDDWSDSDTEVSDEENWRKKVDRFIDALPDDTLLLSLDCHA